MTVIQILGVLVLIVGIILIGIEFFSGSGGAAALSVGVRYNCTKTAGKVQDIWQKCAAFLQAGRDDVPFFLKRNARTVVAFF